MANKEPAKPFIPSSLRFPPDVAILLKQHAYLRNVSTQRLITDILQSWLVYATDYNNPMFNEELIGYAPVQPPTSTRPGYIRSLGFDEPPNEGTTSIPVPPPHKENNEELREFMDFGHVGRRNG